MCPKPKIHRETFVGWWFVVDCELLREAHQLHRPLYNPKNGVMKAEMLLKSAIN